MFEWIILGSLLILAFVSVFSDSLKRSIIYMGVFSLVMALAYLNYNAPDAALAEAAMGVGLFTIMYLVALKKVTVYDICYVNDESDQFDDRQVKEIMRSIIRPLELFIERTEEVEPQIAYTNQPIDIIVEGSRHDFIIHRKGELTYLYGNANDQIFQDIIANMESILTDISNIRVVFNDEVNIDDLHE